MTKRITQKTRTDRAKGQNATIRQDAPTNPGVFRLWAFGTLKTYILLPNPAGGFFAVKPEELLE